MSESSLLTEPTRAQKRNYWVVALSCITLFIASTTIYMVLPIFFQSYGVSNSGIGILISFGTLGGMISGVVAGRMSDRHGRKPLLVLGGALYSSVFFLFAFLGKNFTTFLILRFIEGVAFFMIPVMIVSMAGDTFPALQLGRAIAFFSVSSGVGQLIGPILAGYFLEASDFVDYFIFCGILCSVTVAVQIFFVKETLNRKQAARTAVSEERTISAMLNKFFAQARGLGKVCLIFLGAVMIYRLGYTMVDPLFSIFLKNNLRLDMGTMSWLFAVRALSTIMFAPVSGYCIDKVGRKPMFLAGVLLSGATMIGYCFVSTFEQAMAVRVLDSLAVVVALIVIRTMVADMVKPELRGFGQGLLTISQESTTVGAIFGGIVTDLWGFNGVFLSAAVGAAIALAIVRLWVPEPGEAVGSTKLARLIR